MNEIEHKLALMRRVLAEQKLSGLLLRGTDWFAWATGGRSNVVLQTAETGIAEILVTLRDAFILTDTIEAERLLQEEAASPYLVWSAPWQDPAARRAFVLDQTRGGLVASDQPRGVEYALPKELWLQRRELLPTEQERYRLLGREAAEAMTDALQQATPEWTEYRLAAEGAAALWKRGIEPALILVSGEHRLPLYRHPPPRAMSLGQRAMMVFCARRHGLFANLTRFVTFRQPTEAEEKIKHDLARIEAAAWDGSRPGAQLAFAFKKIIAAYEKAGYPDEPGKHHQGGPTGYLAREDIVTAETQDPLRSQTALAWNPSITGSKIEDTVLIHDNDVEILTVDPRWPTFACGNQVRPDYLVKT